MMLITPLLYINTGYKLRLPVLDFYWPMLCNSRISENWETRWESSTSIKLCFHFSSTEGSERKDAAGILEKGW